MKKTICLLFVACMAICVSAQSLWDISKPDRRLYFEISTGINNSSLSDDNASASKLGYHVGAYANYSFIKSFSMETGLVYSKKGFESRFGNASMQYVQIPLLAVWNFETVTHVLFHLSLGPYFSYGMAGHISYTPYTVQTFYYYDQDCFGKHGFFKDYDSGISVGGSIQLRSIKLGISYEWGLCDIAEVYETTHNRNFSISLGYVF